MIMKLKMEILIWKLVHRALLLAVGSAILAFGISAVERRCCIRQKSC